MKRTAGAVLLLASLGGCMQTDRNKTAYFNQAKAAAQAKKATGAYQGPYGEPITAGNNPATGMSPGLVNAGYTAGTNPRAGTDLIAAGYLNNADETCPPGRASVGGEPSGADRSGGLGYGRARGEMPAPPFYNKMQGIVPVGPQGPNGAVAAVALILPKCQCAR